MRSPIKVVYHYIKGLGVPHEYKDLIEYLHIMRNNTSHMRKITIESDTGHKLIYENTARWDGGHLHDDGWYCRCEDPKTKEANSQ